MQKTKSVPIPAPRKVYGFDELEIGESIYVNGQATSVNNSAGLSCIAAPTAHQYGKSSGKKFTARNEGGGVRIWRVK